MDDGKNNKKLKEDQKEILLKLYDNQYGNVIGPYIVKRNSRYTVLLRDYNNNKNKTMSYPKALLEIKNNKRFSLEETADHIDNDVTNNNLNNLQILTRRENILKGFRDGVLSAKPIIDAGRSEKGRIERSKRMEGHENNNAKFKNEEIPELRKKFTNGEISKRDIMESYNITRRAVENMLQGTTYKKQEGPLSPQKFHRRKLK